MYGRDFLFGNEDIPSRKERFSRFVRKIRNAAQKPGSTLTSGLILSVFFHSIILAIILVSYQGPGTAGAALDARNMKPILRAMKELAAEGNLPNSTILSPQDMQKLIEILSTSPLFSSAFSEDEKAAILKDLIRRYGDNLSLSGTSGGMADLSLENLLELQRKAGNAEFKPGDRIFSREPHENDLGPAFYKIDRGLQESLKQMKESDKAVAAGPLSSSGDFVAVPGGNGGTVAIPADYYYRKSPYEEMMARGGHIFSVASGFPDVVPKGAASNKAGNLPAAERNLKARNVRGSDRIFVFVQAKGFKAETSGRPPLILSAGERQVILDDLMPFPEEKQVALFVERYLSRYDPDQGELPELFREFIYGNLSNVVLVSDPFVAGFDFLEDLYFGKTTLGLILEAARRPRTRLGTEALFALASFYEFEERTIRRLLDVYGTSGKIIRGEICPGNVHNPKTKALVMAQVIRNLVGRLDGQSGITNPEKILEAYVREERKIYEYLQLRDGEDRDRALFGLGCLAWKRESFREAVDVWRKIDRSFEYRLFKEIRRRIDAYDTGIESESWRFRDMAREISIILEWSPAGEREKHLRRMMALKKWSVRTASPEARNK